MTIVLDAERGELRDGEIRYVMLRADVLMGVARQLPTDRSQDFVRALEVSAFLNSRASFEQYRASGRFADSDFLSGAIGVAATLGWGRWRIFESSTGQRTIEVTGSPFAAGYGAALHPVCGPITGVLRAILSVGYGRDMSVIEQSCAAQGTGCECVFLLEPDVVNAD